MNNELQQIVVTGASVGIGKAIVEKLLNQGVCVVATDRHEQPLQALASEMASDSLSTYAMDLNDLDALNDFCDQLFERGQSVNGLVNNAGIYHGKPLREYEDGELSEAVNVNLLAPMLLSENIGRRLQDEQKSASFVNISSVAGEVGSAESPYGSLKAGVIGLTKCNAMNFAPNVRVNAVSPAAVRETEIFDSIPEYRRAEYIRQEYLDAPINPDGVADTVWFLLSDASRNVTGKVISVDNGCYPR